MHSIKTISNSCSSWLVDDSFDVKACYHSCIFCSLSLRIVKVGWNCNYCIFYSFPKIRFCSFFHFSKHHCRDFFSVKSLFLTFKVHYNLRPAVLPTDDSKRPKPHIVLNNGLIKLSPNESFCVKYSVFWISRNLVLCCITYQSFCI
mmetsp:Transcript_3852/g.3643  ORF Transcript_3852/g.3643 Transcript_3852/m.3643 type:complete len:146 (-) Transcript_3852:161-598(-)